MNKRLIRISVLCVALFLGASVAQASPYIIGKLGLYVPDDGAFESGIGMRGAFGLSFRDLGFGSEPRPGSWLDKMKVEAGLGYYSADIDIPGARGDLTVIPLTVSAIFEHRLPTVPIDLRAGVGLGTYFAEYDTSVRNKSTVKQGLYLNAGVIYNINEKFGIVGDVDYDMASGDVGGWMLNGGLRYRF